MDFNTVAVILAVALVGTGAARAELVTAGSQERSWHLFTHSEGGTVSLLHGLTRDECEKARGLAMPVYASGTAHFITPGDIRRAECFQ